MTAHPGRLENSGRYCMICISNILFPQLDHCIVATTAEMVQRIMSYFLKALLHAEI